MTPRHLLFLFLLCFATGETHATGPRRNVLLVLVDDAGYNDFGFMGSPDLPTPHLDQLASRGVVFTDAHVSATVCSPSRAGLITGRYQQRFGHENNVPPDDQGMDPREKTLADLMGAHGYRTALFGKWHLGNRTVFHPNNRGFDEFYGFLEGARSYFPDPNVDQPENYRAILHNRRHVKFEGYLTDVFTEKAIEWMSGQADEPWFVFLSYNAPHTPMHAKEEHLEKFKDHPRQRLAAMTWSLDENIGRLTAFLKDSGQLDDTLIFFLSDNGGAGAHNNQSSNAPLKGWKGNKYEGGHRVPFVVSWPGVIPEGKTFTGLTSAMDIVPTALAAGGIPLPTERPLDGVNLMPYFSGWKTGSPHEALFWRKDRMAAARMGPYKLVRLEGYGYRLYNLSQNLGEDVDLRAKEPQVFSRMIEALLDWESHMGWPWWYEGEAWNRVTYEIHEALMENREPNYLNPDQMQRYEQRNSRP